MFEIYILASEVKFDLGGQRSFLEKVAHLIQEIDRKHEVKREGAIMPKNTHKSFILPIMPKPFSYFEK